MLDAVVWKGSSVAVHAVPQRGALQPVLAAIFAIGLCAKVLSASVIFLGAALHKEAFQPTARTTPETHIKRPSSPFVPSCSLGIAPTEFLLWGLHLISGFSGWLGFGSGHHLPSIEG